MEFATLKAAEAIVGTFGTPSKMPGYAYGLPARRCPIGSMLVKIKGSVCSSCYALKGRYAFPNVQAAQERRFQSLKHPHWTDAITYMVKRRKCTYFRWHDSGDIQGLWHLDNIVAVALRCPKTKFWIPTRENHVVRQYLRAHPKGFPKNLVVRVSAAMINGKPVSAFPNTSTVVTDGTATCPAYKQGGMCGKCRACWTSTVDNVSYPKH